MTSKGKKGTTAPAAVEEPPEREVIPGKVTESQWLELLRGEESSVVAGEVVEGLVDLAFAVWQDHYLEEQSFPYAIQAAKSSLLQIIEWEFLQRDEGERDPGNDPSWLEDDEPVCSVIDSWARGIVPQSSAVSDGDTNPHPLSDSSNTEDEAMSLQSGRNASAASSAPLKARSRQPTRASTVCSSSSYATATRRYVPRDTAQPTRSRPQAARRSQARLVALTTQPLTDDSHSQPGTEDRTQVPSPAHSHTPTTSPPPLSSSHPPLLPYNMKPAQLCWQKDVTYDSSGKIVDMIQLDPSYFPSHRVRPKVHVSDPTPSRGRKHHHSVITSHHSHSSPFSLSHVTKLGKPIAVAVGPCIKGDGVRRGRESVRGDGARREGVRRDGVMVKKSVGQLGLTRRGEDMLRGAVTESQRKETTCRFPDVLTLPPLVDTINVSAGVSVREGTRTVHGPSSPHRPPHFLLSHTTMLPVHYQTTSTAAAAFTTGDAT